MRGSESLGRSKKVRAASATWWAAKGTGKATAKVLGGAKKGMGAAGRKTLGPDKYRRQADEVNARLSDSLQKLEAVLNRQQQRISELEAELAKKRGSDK